jgi:hypothetical protein
MAPVRDLATVQLVLRGLTGEHWAALANEHRDRQVLLEHLLAELDQLVDAIDSTTAVDTDQVPVPVASLAAVRVATLTVRDVTGRPVDKRVITHVAGRRDLVLLSLSPADARRGRRTNRHRVPGSCRQGGSLPEVHGDGDVYGLGRAHVDTNRSRTTSTVIR